VAVVKKLFIYKSQSLEERKHATHQSIIQEEALRCKSLLRLTLVIKKAEKMAQ
jgi:hypothetical protein